MTTPLHPDPLAFLAEELDDLRNRGLYRPLKVMSSGQGPIVSVDERRLISLSSNDYLGLTHHPRLRKSALDAVRDYGAGSGAVRTIAGTMTLHEDLERELAAFKGTEATLTFQSGFTANTGVIPTITGEQDLIVSDELNHASIIDGMRLSKAPRKIYRHADTGHLREILDDAVEHGRDGTGLPYRLILVVTDGVFSMDGDIAPLPGIVEAAESANAAVFVDDAHASGVLGRQGRGSVDHFGLHGRVAIQVGTLSKAVGVLGGYVAGTQDLRDILVQRARPFLFSTSHPPAVAAACREAIKVMQDEPELHERLWTNTRRFKAELARLGFDIGRSETPITPVMMGDPDTAGRFSQRLVDEGVFAQPVVFPTVAIDRARIRTIVTAAHADAQLDRALEAFDTVGREFGLISG
jgi:glycine C-acetyltransferase